MAVTTGSDPIRHHRRSISPRELERKAFDAPESSEAIFYAYRASFIHEEHFNNLELSNNVRGDAAFRLYSLKTRYDHFLSLDPQAQATPARIDFYRSAKENETMFFLKEAARMGNTHAKEELLNQEGKNRTKLH